MPVAGAPAKVTGVGDFLFPVAAYGANRWLGPAIAQGRGAEQRLAWWNGTTIGAAQRGGTLREAPWEAGRVAAFPDGAAVIAYTTMRPRRGAGSNLRPRVVVVARGSHTGFGATRRVSPLPPGPPYGAGLGPALSATDVTVATGGRATVVVAWQRVGRIEARVSRDRGRTYGPMRYLGPSPEAFPSLTARVSPAGKVLVVWGGREAQGPTRVLVSRAAIAAPGKGFVMREFDRSAPLDLSAPSALDQRGPQTLAGFDGETPFAAWQTVVDGRTAVRTARLQGDAMTATFTAPAGKHALLDDLTTTRLGSAAIGWHTVTAFGRPQSGFPRAGARRRAVRRRPADPRARCDGAPSCLMSRRACSPYGTRVRRSRAPLWPPSFADRSRFGRLPRPRRLARRHRGGGVGDFAQRGQLGLDARCDERDVGHRVTVGVHADADLARRRMNGGHADGVLGGQRHERDARAHRRSEGEEPVPGGPGDVRDRDVEQARREERPGQQGVEHRRGEPGEVS